jgi:hypothetical protein
MRDNDAWNAGLCCEDLLTTQFVEDEGSRRGEGLLDVLESRRFKMKRLASETWFAREQKRASRSRMRQVSSGKSRIDWSLEEAVKSWFVGRGC